MNVGIVLCGGTGSRVGANIPKQFIEVLGKPVLVYTLENFENCKEIDCVEIVCHKDWIEYTQKLCEQYNLNKVKWITEGGDDFQRSVIAGINNLKGKIDSDSIVVISFGVSPFTSSDIIEDSIRVAREHGNGISAEDSFLCTCIKDDEYSTTQNLIRETIKGFSNPWSFNFEELCKAYEEAERQGILEGLEPHTTSVYLALGKRLWFSKSNRYNFKITTKEDLDIFEGLLMLKEKRKTTDSDLENNFEEA